MKRSRPVLLLLVLLGTAILLSLGTWQVYRLQWKEGLIAQVEERRASEPVPLVQMEERWRETTDVDYWPVRLEGTFEHAAEQYFYTTHKGAVGWNVYTPLRLNDGRAILVNRGFVPDALRDPADRDEGQVAGPIALTGLARNPLSGKPNRFVPDNEPDNRTYYWKDLQMMADNAEIAPDRLLPFFVDASRSDLPGGLPQGGTTIIEFPNNHLQYAITWYGLAAALIAVAGFFLYGGNGGRNKNRESASLRD